MPSSAARNDRDRQFALQPVPCLDIDRSGAIVRANPAFCAIAGRTEPELRELGLLSIVWQDAQDEVARALLDATNHETVSFDAPICRPDSELRWLEWRGVMEPARNIVQFITHDVTTSRRVKSEMQERERFLTTLLANLPGMAYRCRNDPDWTMEFVSAGCLALTGYEVDDLLFNKTTSFGDLFHPDDAQPVWNAVQEALTNKEPFTLQYRIRTKGGEQRWCFEQGRGVFADNGELLALEGFITDITHRVKAEEELRDKLTLIEAQRNQIADLSLPIIEVWDGVLTLPIVGVLDDARSARIMEGLLDAVVRTQSEHVILDLTAVASVDAAVAEHLVSILRAVKLLGARGVLSGIRPAVAQSLVGLSADLGGIPTTSDLRGALRSCMRLDAKNTRTRKG